MAVCFLRGDKHGKHPGTVFWADKGVDKGDVSAEAKKMVDVYDDNSIDYFEDDDDLDSSDAAFMRGYLKA